MHASMAEMQISYNLLGFFRQYAQFYLFYQQVLVTNMNRKYQTCSAYCGSIGRDCLGAWEEVSGDFSSQIYQRSHYGILKWEQFAEVWKRGIEVLGTVYIIDFIVTEILIYGNIATCQSYIKSLDAKLTIHVCLLSIPM